jgi:hypothetical protein
VGGLTELRPYQAEAARAILESARLGLGLTFVVEMARQSGKNELSAWVESVLMARSMVAGGNGVKAAPTFKPQVLYSIDRLTGALQRAGLSEWARVVEGHIVRLGRARWTFYSAEPSANVVGGTASLLLEVDEAQDVSSDKFDRDFRPMASAFNATTVLYGTAWEETSLLEATLYACREAERKDGQRRAFIYPWEFCARQNPAYGKFVLAERERLGPTHPLFTTQYELKPLAGGGRLLSPAVLDLMRGGFPRGVGAVGGSSYVAGLDVAGEASPDVVSRRGPDYTALSVGELVWRGGDLPEVEVVALYRWQGVPHDELYPLVTRLLRDVWAVKRVAVDSTAIGEAAALLLQRALGKDRVVAYRYTQRSKSSLGYGLQAAAGTGRVRVFADDGSPEWRALWDELRLCRASYSASRVLSWEVDPSDGNDDLANSLALCVEAAGVARRAVARGRRGDVF